MYTNKGIWAPWWLSGQESSCNAGVQVQSLGQEDRLEKKWQPTPVFLPGTFPCTVRAWWTTVCGVTKESDLT